MKGKKLPEFKTKRLFLRGIRLSDVKSYEKHFVDYEIIQFLKTVPWPYPKGGVKKYFKNVIFPNQGVDLWNWGIFLKEKPKECIGSYRPAPKRFWCRRQRLLAVKKISWKGLDDGSCSAGFRLCF